MAYKTVQKVYHWLTALLVLGLLCSGLAYSFELADRSIIQSHQIVGQVLIVLVALRLITRFRYPPREPEAHAPWERALANGVHILLYVLLIVFLVSGYVSASALREPMLLFPLDQGFARSETGELILEVHFASKWALLVLFGLHFAGTLKHAIIDRDGSFSRMWFSANKG